MNINNELSNIHRLPFFIGSINSTIIIYVSIFTFLDALDGTDLEHNDDDGDEGDSLSDEEGWESDSSGYTTTRDQSSHDEAPHQSPLKKNHHEDEQNCAAPEKGKTMQFKQPLSSTLACDSTGISEIKVDPKLSPVELQSNNVFKELEKHHNVAPIHILDQGPGCSFMPGILAENVLTSTKLESSPELPTIRHKVLPQEKALSPMTIASLEKEERATTNENPGPEALPSFAQAVLNTRNKIANVLFKAVTDFQKGSCSSSRDSGYDSVSTDTASSSTTTQSTTSKESLFLADKLFKEFRNRLTAEIMSSGNNTSCLSETNFSLGSSNSLSRRTQSVEKTKNMTLPNKNRTVSLVTNRKTIKFNPSLPELRKGMSSTPLTSEKRSLYVPLCMNSKTLDQQGRLKTSVSTKAILRISPVQKTSPTALLPKNTIPVTRALSEPVAAQNSPVKLIQHIQAPVILKLPQKQKQPLIKQDNQLQLVKKPENFSKPVIKLPGSSCPCVLMSRRRSVPLTNCLPVTDSEILRHSTNLSDFQRYMQQGRGPEALHGRSLPGHDRGSTQNPPTWRERGDHFEQMQRETPRESLKVHPELHLLPGQDGGTRGFSRLPGKSGAGHLRPNPLKLARKRSFDSALFCANEKTSPKRTCRRSIEDDKKSPSLGKGLLTFKGGAGKEKIMGNLTKKHYENLLNDNGNREVFVDMEVPRGKRECVNASWKKDEAHESKRDVIESKQRRHSQKLFTNRTRSPSARILVPWAPSYADDNSNTSCGSSEDSITVDRSPRSMARIDSRGVISPCHRDHCTKIRGNTLEEFKKIVPEDKRTGGKDSSARVTGSATGQRRSSCTRTSQDDNSCCTDYRRSSYESASEESSSRRCDTAGIRRSSAEAQYFPARDARPILDQNYQSSNQNKCSSLLESESPYTHNSQKLSSRMKLNQGRVERTPTREMHFSSRKRDREHRDKASEVCLNKTFKIDRENSCASGRCMKLFCLNCGTFPSSIQGSSVSSADSFMRN